MPDPATPPDVEPSDPWEVLTRYITEGGVTPVDALAALRALRENEQALRSSADAAHVEPSDPWEVVEEALLSAQRHLGRMGNARARSLTDPDVWKITEPALEALRALREKGERQEAALRAIREMTFEPPNAISSIIDHALAGDRESEPERCPRCE